MKKLLLDSRGRKQIVDTGKDLHTHGGVISKKDLEDMAYSGPIRTHKGVRFFVANPTIVDYIEKMEKRAQIIYPKDSALIIAFTGIGSGSRVLEAGTGVAGLTLMLANTVRPEGRVFSYDTRSEHLEEAKKHLREMGLEKYVELKNSDIYNGPEENNLDLAVLDLPEPWRAIDKILPSLKFGGYLVSYSPSIEQTKRFVLSLPSSFQEIKTIEVLVRSWEISRERCRPNTRMIAHTGFITFARKLENARESERK